MDAEVAAALEREFGYTPREDDGEKWVVYQDNALVVVHPERRVRVYRRGAIGPEDYYEIEPSPWDEPRIRVPGVNYLSVSTDEWRKLYGWPNPDK